MVSVQPAPAEELPETVVKGMEEMHPDGVANVSAIVDFFSFH